MFAHLRDAGSGFVATAREFNELTRAMRGIDGSSSWGIVNQFANGERSTLELQQFT